MPLAEGAELVFVRGYQDLEASRVLLRELRANGGYDGVVALGGPMGVYERDRFPFLGDSIEVLAEALLSGMPVLGLCLGGQLLSEATGTAVFPGSERGLPAEVGFFRLLPTEEGRRDPVSSLFLGTPVLFWHRDTHDLPPAAVLLASTELFHISAFRLAPNAYGLQFHLEITPDLLQMWVAESALARQVDMDEGTLLAEAYAMENVIRSRAASLAQLFLSWVARYRDAGRADGHPDVRRSGLLQPGSRGSDSALKG
jgi:GMP synthase (glutamine-hydrolysing)